MSLQGKCARLNYKFYQLHRTELELLCQDRFLISSYRVNNITISANIGQYYGSTVFLVIKRSQDICQNGFIIALHYYVMLFVQACLLFLKVFSATCASMATSIYHLQISMVVLCATATQWAH